MWFLLYFLIYRYSCNPFRRSVSIEFFLQVICRLFVLYLHTLRIDVYLVIFLLDSAVAIAAVIDIDIDIDIDIAARIVLYIH